MKTPGLKIGTALSLLVHLALLQGLVLIGVNGETAPVESEIIMVELAGPAIGEGTPEPVVKLDPPPAPVAPTVKAKPRVIKSVKRPALSEREVLPSNAEPADDVRGRLAESVPTAISGISEGGSAPGVGEGSGAVRAGYGSQLASWLNRFKQYPTLARRRGIEGDAKVRLVIERSGTLLASSLPVASGSTLLDESALAMVKAASPFPRVPDELSGERFEFDVPVSFRLR